MKVTLLHHTPLWVADKAIGKCWDKPTPNEIEFGDLNDERGYEIPGCNIERIDRVANKNRHSSTIEHLYYNFDIDGISRACLQELARHRIASLSVKSTRYTLKELKNEEAFVSYSVNNGSIYREFVGIKRARKYVVFNTYEEVNNSIMIALEELRSNLIKGLSNDIAKYCLPEAYKTSLVWTINARSLQNFLQLRTSKSALQEIRELAYNIYEVIPKDHKFLFKEYINERKD